MAPETQHVEPFGRHRLADGATDAMNATLELDVFLHSEGVDHIGAVLERRNQRVPEEGRPLGEKRHAHVVAEDDAVILSLTRHDRADEAASFLGRGRDGLDVGGDIERDLRVARQLRVIRHGQSLVSNAGCVPGGLHPAAWPGPNTWGRTQCCSPS